MSYHCEKEQEKDIKKENQFSNTCIVNKILFTLKSRIFFFLLIEPEEDWLIQWILIFFIISISTKWYYKISHSSHYSLHLMCTAGMTGTGYRFYRHISEFNKRGWTWSFCFCLHNPAFTLLFTQCGKKKISCACGLLQLFLFHSVNMLL